MMQLEEWLDDLCVRFIVNIPAEELRSIERICFQIEEAQWYYEDFVRPSDPSLPTLGLKPFFTQITQRCPLFDEWPPEELGNAFERFLKYKKRVPIRGAILLNEKMDQVLLVKGYKKSGTWSFPRGKINKDEDDLDCAVREAWEETGFDILAAGLIKDRRKIRAIEKTIHGQHMKLFVFRGVSQEVKFVPQTRKEISKVEWFKLAELPTEKKRNQTEGAAQPLNANKFYVVAPFIHDLKKYISAERKRENRKSSRLAAPPKTADTVPAQQFQYQAPYDSGPISPPIPSSLPEVNPATVQNPVQNPVQYLQQPAISTLPALASQADAKAKSHALLALLQKGSTAEVPHVHHTLLEPSTFATQPKSPVRPSVGSHPHTDAITSPPPLDLQPSAHPMAPPSSALPQLNQHTRSLLEAFNKPSSSQPVLSHQLPPEKKNLLAAFMSQPKFAPQPTPSPASNAGNELLQLLRRDASPVVQAKGFDTVTLAPSTQGQPTPRDPSDSSSGQAPPAATTSSLLDLLRPTPQDAPLISKPTMSYAAAAGTPAAPSQTAQSKTQKAPVELSAVAERNIKPPEAGNKKEDALSLVGTKPAKPAGGKSRSGTTSATLDRPYDEPQFDAIAKAPIFDEDMKREPVPAHKKLFDPKHDQPKHPHNIKVLPNKEDRSRQPKSPRTPRQKQGNTSGPPTPKELQKPFQPQILKRPQTSEGDGPVGLPSLPTTVSEQEVKPAAKISPIHPVAEPVSPRQNAPQAVAPLSLADMFAKSASMPQDPQREALLSLLKSPAHPPAAPEAGATPKASATKVAQSQQLPAEIVAAPVAGQLVSPVMDGEQDVEVPRSRVSSLASTSNLPAGSRPLIEKRQTAPGDKAFLLGMLKGLAGGAPYEEPRKQLSQGIVSDAFATRFGGVDDRTFSSNARNLVCEHLKQSWS